MKHTGTPVIVDMQVVPAAGYDSMLFNLCGAHGAFFTRNVVVLRDSAGQSGVGEVPGGEGIRQALEAVDSAARCRTTGSRTESRGTRRTVRDQAGGAWSAGGYSTDCL